MNDHLPILYQAVNIVFLCSKLRRLSLSKKKVLHIGTSRKGYPHILAGNVIRIVDLSFLLSKDFFLKAHCEMTAYEAMMVMYNSSKALTTKKSHVLVMRT